MRSVLGGWRLFGLSVVGGLVWAYGEVVHDDYAKELKWSMLGPPGQGLVRQMAYDYMALLLEQAAFMRQLITHGLERNVLDSST